MEYGIAEIGSEEHLSALHREGVRHICAILRGFVNEYYRTRKAFQKRRSRPAKIPALNEGETLATRDGTQYEIHERGWRNPNRVEPVRLERIEKTVEKIKVSRRSRRKYKAMANRAYLRNLRARTEAAAS